MPEVTGGAELLRLTSLELTSGQDLLSHCAWTVHRTPTCCCAATMASASTAPSWPASAFSASSSFTTERNLGGIGGCGGGLESGLTGRLACSPPRQQYSRRVPLPACSSNETGKWQVRPCSQPG